MAVPAANSLDRRTRQRLLRGKAEIEGRLDLHGDSAEVAYVRLRGFLGTAQGRGLRLVLVITGKGSGSYVRHTLHGEAHWHAPEREGVFAACCRNGSRSRSSRPWSSPTSRPIPAMAAAAPGTCGCGENPRG